MKVLAWNSHGLCSHAAALAMQSVINSARPNVIFISETIIINSARLNVIFISETKSSIESLIPFFSGLDFPNNTGVDAIGLWGVF